MEEFLSELEELRPLSTAAREVILRKARRQVLAIGLLAELELLPPRADVEGKSNVITLTIQR
jgi:hypothetical protein